MIHAKTKTTVKGQEKVNRLMEIIRKHPKASVDIGFFEGAGSYQGKNAPSVVEVALWNEYGTATSPARAFMGPAVDDNTALINRWREEAIEKIFEHGWSVEKALEMIGFRMKTLIENKIKSNVPPPNAPSTIAAKQGAGLLPKTVKIRNTKISGESARTVLSLRGKTNTLIDSGTMLRSVTYKVNL